MTETFFRTALLDDRETEIEAKPSPPSTVTP